MVWGVAKVVVSIARKAKRSQQREGNGGFEEVVLLSKYFNF